MQGIDLDIPKDKIVLVVGKNGSGKKALVIDTIFSEGYLRYVESVSSIKHHRNIIERPEYESIENLSPVIKFSSSKIEQTNKLILDILGIKKDIFLMFSKLSEAYCLKCGSKIQKYTVAEIIDILIKKKDNVYFLFEYKGDIHYLINRGYYYHLENDEKKRISVKEKEKKILVIIDKLSCEKLDKKRAKEALRKSLELNKMYFLLKMGGEKFKYPIDLFCQKCNYKINEPRIELFQYRVTGANSKKQIKFHEQTKGFKINNKNISEFMEISLKGILPFIKKIKKVYVLDDLILNSLENVLKKVKLLNDFELEYLELKDQVSKLSSGELQKVQFTNLNFARLNKVVILIENISILSSPVIQKNVFEILKKLKQKGNSVIIICNEKGIVKIADYFIEIGPGSGIEGGTVTFSGTKEQFLDFQKKNKQDENVDKNIDKTTIKNNSFIKFQQKQLEFLIPAGKTILIQGPAGSGKSKLLKEIYRSSIPVRDKFYSEFDLGVIKEKSNVFMFLEIYKEIQKIMAKQHESKINNMLPGDFSFYSNRGRCINCKGKGYKIQKIKNLPEIKIKCVFCKGVGIKPEAASIKFRGYYFFELLKLKIKDIVTLFENEIDHQKLEAIKKVTKLGMGYLGMGQRLNTLSKFELSRLYLIKHLIYKTKNSMFLLDNSFENSYQGEKKQISDLIIELNKSNNTVIIIQNDQDSKIIVDYVIVLKKQNNNRSINIDFQGNMRDYLYNTKQ